MVDLSVDFVTIEPVSTLAKQYLAIGGGRKGVAIGVGTHRNR